jgi:hypothetical protein
MTQVGTADIYVRPTSNALIASRQNEESPDKGGAAAFGRSEVAT